MGLLALLLEFGQISLLHIFLLVIVRASIPGSFRRCALLALLVQRLPLTLLFLRLALRLILDDQLALRKRCAVGPLSATRREQAGRALGGDMPVLHVRLRLARRVACCAGERKYRRAAKERAAGRVIVEERVRPWQLAPKGAHSSGPQLPLRAPERPCRISSAAKRACAGTKRNTARWNAVATPSSGAYTYGK